jgi:hypothetical protein
MKIKEISKTVRLSHNYNSFEQSMTATIEEGDDITLCSKELYEKCMALVKEDIQNSLTTKEQLKEQSFVKKKQAFPRGIVEKKQW